jgi:hypothetical protein
MLLQFTKKPTRPSTVSRNTQLSPGTTLLQSFIATSPTTACICSATSFLFDQTAVLHSGRRVASRGFFSARITPADIAFLFHLLLTARLGLIAQIHKGALVHDFFRTLDSDSSVFSPWSNRHSRRCRIVAARFRIGSFAGALQSSRWLYALARRDLGSTGRHRFRGTSFLCIVFFADHRCHRMGDVLRFGADKLWPHTIVCAPVLLGRVISEQLHRHSAGARRSSGAYNTANLRLHHGAQRVGAREELLDHFDFLGSLDCYSAARAAPLPFNYSYGSNRRDYSFSSVPVDRDPFLCTAYVFRPALACVGMFRLPVQTT